MSDTPERHLKISPEEAGRRLDQVLAARFPELSRGRLQSLIKEGHVLRGDRAFKPGHKTREGEVFTVREPALKPVETLPENIPLQVLYEDDDLIVVNKPPGLVVHPGAGNTSGTLVNALLHHCDDLSGIGGEERPGIVHRLDKETSGCMVAAKNDFAHQALSSQFEQRTTRKIYLAVTRGGFQENAGSIRKPIFRHPVHRKKMAVVEEGRGRPAWTDYRVLAENREHHAALVQCLPRTGRTHQIRVHLASINHPLFGDDLYGGAEARRAARQLLHSWQLEFEHPRTAERLNFRASVPEDIPRLFPDYVPAT
jgi:23S rRNA pseudouridine1911/1915/1917 synthase